MSEPGHMRCLPAAAYILKQVEREAVAVARGICDQIGLPFVEVSGVNVIDRASPLLQRYLALTAGEPGLYGSGPYLMDADERRLMLRQTGCIQKFAACKRWQLTEEVLPTAIFEISDSFRCEAEEVLQLAARLRRFRLPETHIHAKNVCAAMSLSLELHERIAGEVLRDDDMEILVSAPHHFVTANNEYLTALASATGRPVLLREYPAGQMCEDGVELDVEYKVIDSCGCAREISTFQIDEQITRSFDLTYETREGHARTPGTIHAVFTGSVERATYLILDRIAKGEGRGERARLPLQLAPVIVRILASADTSGSDAAVVAAQLESYGIRAEIDDRDCPIEQKQHEADVELVPYQIVMEAPFAGPELRVVEHGSGVMRDRSLEALVVEVRAQVASALPPRVSPRLSRRPTLATSQGTNPPVHAGGAAV
jgi:threonyl-tRNA synthetase